MTLIHVLRLLPRPAPENDAHCSLAHAEACSLTCWRLSYVAMLLYGSWATSWSKRCNCLLSHTEALRLKSFRIFCSPNIVFLGELDIDVALGELSSSEASLPMERLAAIGVDGADEG